MDNNISREMHGSLCFKVALPRVQRIHPWLWPPLVSSSSKTKGGIPRDFLYPFYLLSREHVSGGLLILELETREMSRKYSNIATYTL